MTAAIAAPCRFEHDAFIYSSDSSYVETLVPLIRETLTHGEVVMVVVPARKARLLRGALGVEVSGVRFVDSARWYRHPIETLSGYDDVVGGLGAGERAFVIGEVEFGTTESEWVSWTRYESAINWVLQNRCARVICPYDASVLPAVVVENARRTHPYLVCPTTTAPSEEYVHPERLFKMLAPTATAPSGDPDVDLVLGKNLRIARGFVQAAAAARGLDQSRAEELTLAVNEVVTNALVHGGGHCRLRIWHQDPDELTFVVDDDGPGLGDPLIGYFRPSGDAVGGHGAWIARHLFDRCEFLQHEGGGTTVVMAAIC